MCLIHCQTDVGRSSKLLYNRSLTSLVSEQAILHIFFSIIVYTVSIEVSLLAVLFGPIPQTVGVTSVGSDQTAL